MFCFGHVFVFYFGHVFILCFVDMFLYMYLFFMSCMNSFYLSLSMTLEIVGMDMCIITLCLSLIICHNYSCLSMILLYACVEGELHLKTNIYDN